MPDIIPTPQDGTEEQDPVIPQADPAPAAAPEPEIPQEPNPQPEPTPQPEPAPAPAPQPLPDVNERYRQSSSEAMILNGKNKTLEDTLNKLTSEDTPTEAELLAEYPEFKQYNATTQKLMRDTLETKKRQRRIDLSLIQDRAERQLEHDLRTVTSQEKYSSLRTDDKFKDFVLKPQHKGVDIQTLADAYLVRTGKIQPDGGSTPPPAPAPAAPSSGIPRGSGGPRTTKPKKLTIEEASVLRQTNYKEYMRQLRAGNIEEEV